MVEAKRRKRRMMILSFDAVGARDLKDLSMMPNLQKLIEQGAYCNQVQSVYPSLTYPAHTSMITGRKPNRHGIVNNTKLQPRKENPDWNSDASLIRAATLYEAAAKRGDRVCTLLWPVTGKSKYIKYNLPEIHAYGKGQNQILEMLKNGSFGYELRLMPYAKGLLKGVRQPELDDFLQKSVLYTIRKYNPELVMVHFLDVDSNRHKLGLDHPEIGCALKRLDRKLGEILQALRETKAGECHSMEDTTVVVFGDHCQKSCDTVFYPNYVLKEQGMLSCQDGRITSYQAVAKNCDGSCYIYLNPAIRRDKQLTQDMTQKLTKLFKEMSDQENGPISRVFTGDEAAFMGADDECVIMLEAKEGFYFLDDTEVLTRKVDELQNHKMLATHGYLPDLPDYETFFAMSGYGVKKGARPGPMRLWDEAPTLARIMGLKLPDTDGRVIHEMLDFNEIQDT